jgi:hypothetical protein
MNLKKLKEAEHEFLELYPGGFANPEMLEMAKKHRIDKIVALARQSFAQEKFTNTNEIIENMIKVVSRSSMVSLFEKPKFRDFANSLAGADSVRLSTGLEQFLYGDEEDGFNRIVETLKKGKLAKWSLVTVCPFYFRPTVEVFLKPTTVKNVIQYFEIKELEYKPAPTFLFYKNYRDVVASMKKEVHKSLTPDNAHFSGFLMMSMENFHQ